MLLKGTFDPNAVCILCLVVPLQVDGVLGHTMLHLTQFPYQWHLVHYVTKVLIYSSQTLQVRDNLYSLVVRPGFGKCEDQGSIPWLSLRYLKRA